MKTETRDFIKYVGEFKNHLRHGHGKLSNDKYSYEGDWKDDLKDGKGVEIINNGDMTYEGQFKFD